MWENVPSTKTLFLPPVATHLVVALCFCRHTEVATGGEDTAVITPRAVDGRKDGWRLSLPSPQCNRFVASILTCFALFKDVFWIPKGFHVPWFWIDLLQLIHFHKSQPYLFLEVGLCLAYSFMCLMLRSSTRSKSTMFSISLLISCNLKPNTLPDPTLGSLWQ